MYQLAWSLQFLGYLRNLSLKFQKAMTKIGSAQLGRVRKTPILVWTFWNFKLKVLNYSRNCILHATLIPNLVKPLLYILFQSIDWKIHHQKSRFIICSLKAKLWWEISCQNIYCVLYNFKKIPLTSISSVLLIEI